MKSLPTLIASALISGCSIQQLVIDRVGGRSPPGVLVISYVPWFSLALLGSK